MGALGVLRHGPAFRGPQSCGRNHVQQPRRGQGADRILDLTAHPALHAEIPLEPAAGDILDQKELRGGNAGHLGLLLRPDSVPAAAARLLQLHHSRDGRDSPLGRHPRHSHRRHLPHRPRQEDTVNLYRLAGSLLQPRQSARQRRTGVAGRRADDPLQDHQP